MLSPNAPPDQAAYIKSVMAQIDPHGYAQAARMLSGACLVRALAQVTCPISVASGSADTITPPDGCQRAATAARTTLLDLGPVGHACPLEAAGAVNHLLAGATP
jgi:pimeloyl-ACP methyl ester carboxylesterase